MRIDWKLYTAGTKWRCSLTSHNGDPRVKEAKNSGEQVSPDNMAEQQAK